jgi:hypothetical protein
MSLVLLGLSRLLGRHRIDVSSGKLDREDFGLRFSGVMFMNWTVNLFFPSIVLIIVCAFALRAL